MSAITVSSATAQELIDVIQACLEQKIAAGFDASAALSLELAQELAIAVENKCNTYTDVQIANLTTLIGGDDVDLTPFTDFMAQMNTLLDGDDSQEGMQIFNTLLADVANNKTVTTANTTTIAAIQQNLTSISTTLIDHGDRITQLEQAAHAEPDLTGAGDELIAIVTNAHAVACNASRATIEAHQTSVHSDTMETFRNTMNPTAVSVSFAAVTDGYEFTVVVDSDRTDIDGAEVAVIIDGVQTTGPVTLVDGTGTYTLAIAMDDHPELPVIAYATIGGNPTPYSAQATVPEVTGALPEDGDGDGAVL